MVRKMINANDALRILKEGNERFINDKCNLRNINAARREKLHMGQNPYAVIVSCSDSRINPSLIFNVGLGEIFEVRVAGNIINDDMIASIEYAVKYLNTPLIAIIGHEDCGAVKSTYDMINKKETYSCKLTGLLKKIELNIAKSKSMKDAIKNNIEKSAQALKEYDVIREMLDKGKIKIVKGYYNLDGKVEFF